MESLLLVHIVAGSLGLATGAAALAVRKGARLHRGFGKAFVAAMLVMAGAGAVLAAVQPERGTTLIGILAFYLVLTAWMTVRRPEGSIGWFDHAALLAALGATATLVAFGAIAAGTPNGRLDSLPGFIHYIFGTIIGLAAWCDFHMIRRGGLFGAARIRRHVWRMCTALLIAAFSFFIGQQKVMPVVMRGSPLLFLPELLVFGAMLYWMIRTSTKSTRSAIAG